MEFKKLDMGQEVTWYGCGWNLFRQAASMWVLTGVLFLVFGYMASDLDLW